MPTTRPFDAAEYLETAADQAYILNDAVESGDPRVIAHALGAVARARGGIARLARDSGLSRQSLHRALGEGGNPTLDTILKVLRALDLRMRIEEPGGATATAETMFPDRNALAAFCRRNGIRRLSLFGSRLKGNARPGSDVDLLVDFEPDRIPGLLDIARMEFELSDMLGGAKVDLRTAKDLSIHFRNDVVRTAELLHAA